MQTKQICRHHPMSRLNANPSQELGGGNRQKGAYFGDENAVGASAPFLVEGAACRRDACLVGDVDIHRRVGLAQDRRRRRIAQPSPPTRRHHEAVNMKLTQTSSLHRVQWLPGQTTLACPPTISGFSSTSCACC
jgi:hypothetical protein